MADETMFEQVTDNQQAPESPQPITLTVDPSYKEFIDQYVGEGKKYPHIGELAKAYANADRHIPELTRDLGALKMERDSLKDLLLTNLANGTENSNTNETESQQQVNSDTNSQEQTPAQPPAGAPPSGEANKEVDLRKVVREALNEASEEERARKNALETERVMLERYENREAAVKAVQDKAEELGVSAQWIAQLAFTSPKAYYATMGIDPANAPKSNNTPAPRSDVNPQRLADANPGVKPGTYAWYQNLRKADPNKFRSQAVQSALMKDAQENPNFYT